MATTQRQLIEAIRTTDDPRRKERLRSIIQLTRAAQERGESITFDPSVITRPTFKDDELLQLFDAARTADDVVAAAKRAAHLAKSGSLNTVTLTTYRLSDGELIEDDDTRLRNVPRYCLAGFMKAIGHEIRAFRITGRLPDSDTAHNPKLAEKHGIPYPSGEEMDDIVRAYNWDDNPVLAWQHHQVVKQLIEISERESVLPVATDPTTSGTYTVVVVDRERVEELTGGEYSRIHYLSNLFSNAGEIEPGVPDYRVVDHLALSSEEMNEFSVFLGLGPFRSDGSGIYIHNPVTWKQVQKAATLAGSTLTEEEAKRRARLLNRERSKEFQFRAAHIEHRFNSRKKRTERRMASLMKGTFKTLDRGYVESRIAAYHEQLEALSRRGRALAQAGQVREAADMSLQRYTLSERFDGVLRKLQWLLAGSRDMALVVKGDQIKVGEGARGTLYVAGTYLKGKPARKAYADPEATITLTRSKHAAHAVVDETPPQKPVQYRVPGNGQVVQFLTNETTDELAQFVGEQADQVAESLKTPAGIASLISETARDERTELEMHLLGLAGESPVIRERKFYDGLREALDSSLIRLDTKGSLALMRGEEVPPGSVIALPALVSRIDKLAAARLRSILRSFGLLFYGYHHTNTVNSRSLINYLNGYERARRSDFAENGGEWTETTVRAQPFSDPSTVYLPQVITGLMSADDDGDITIGMATHVWTGGRLVKVVVLLRYPCVDAPILWVLPAGSVTPFDARSDEEDARFKQFIDILQVEIPDGANIHSDEIVLGYSNRLIRLANRGAKDGIEKVPLEGSFDAEGAMKLIERKWSLNETGARTRRHERFAVLLNRALDTIKTPGHQTYYTTLFDLTVLNMLGLEEQLTGFKYDTHISRAPGLALGEGDVFGFNRDSEVLDAIPLDYHAHVRGLRSVLARHAGRLDVSLERFPKLSGWGKETAIVQQVVDRVRGPMVRAISSMRPGLKELESELLATLEARGITGELSAADQAGVATVLQAMELWTTSWRSLIEVYSERKQRAVEEHDEERSKEAEEFRSRAGRGLRRQMALMTENVSDEAFMYAFARLFRERRQKDQERYEHAMRTASVYKTTPYSGAALLAMLEGGRIPRIFPAGHIEVEVTGEARLELEVFTRGKNLPLPPFGEAEAEVFWSREKACYLTRLGGEVVPLFLRRGAEETPLAATCRLKRITPRSGILIFPRR